MVDISRARSARNIFNEELPATMIYWATNHLLARLYCDFNTQKTTKSQVYTLDVSRSSAENFDCNEEVYMYFVRF